MTRLQELLKNKHFTMRSFARHVGMEHTYVRRVVKGDRWPGIINALKIAAALGEDAASIWPMSSGQRAKAAGK